jgi:DNA-binding MarR family transcriptional regulator|tara:strand:+ start:387 stop:833 length:447 start_codon:yes stop_codon:yes gene_type:complete
MINNTNSHLKLEKQLCFRLYSLSKKMNRLYTPLLKELSLTYPQYLVMLVLWDSANSVSIKTLALALDLDTGTLSPLLKRMETIGIISRYRNKDDERSVDIYLTESGQQLKDKAIDIPAKMLSITGLTPKQLLTLTPQLDQLLINLGDL